MSKKERKKEKGTMDKGDYYIFFNKVSPLSHGPFIW
jgi:hypothetical protein